MVRRALIVVAAIASSSGLRMADLDELDDGEVDAPGDEEIDDGYFDDVDEDDFYTQDYYGYGDEEIGDIGDLIDMLQGEIPEELLASLFGGEDGELEIPIIREDDDDDDEADDGSVKLVQDDDDDDEVFENSDEF